MKPAAAEQRFLRHRGKAIVFEAAGYSPLGPVALNCFAPDEGNMHLLEAVAEQRQLGLGLVADPWKPRDEVLQGRIPHDVQPRRHGQATR